MVGFIVLAIVCAGVAVAVVRYRLKKKRKKEKDLVLELEEFDELTIDFEEDEVQRRIMRM